MIRIGPWIADYAYAAGRQLGSIFGGRDVTVLSSGDRAPVVMIPGVWETWRFLGPLARLINARGHPVHVLPELGTNRGSVAAMAAVAARFIEARNLDRVIIVAHSKGGLIGKHLMLGASGSRVSRLIAIATPFAGSAYASFLPVRSLRLFRPNDETILLLARDVATNARIVSIYPQFDPHIPGGSELRGATNVELPIDGHFRILRHPLLIQAVADHLEA
ncbi:triacylglycerol lipase [Diaminobutyricimonas sp. LJ205]|uniref:esterase/lipase family protein n=1 Tax=Diaminobutyricimonas sp. LJ205 TaxID=2683590 RepID=UPI0012F477F4|nr:alpha/beta fold hydrolase [Diaminobutyricimonas sp. LJ205]